MINKIADQALKDTDARKPVTIVLFSSNKPKQVEYQAAIGYLRTQGYDIRIVPASRLIGDHAIHHNAEEDQGTLQGNSLQKMGEAIQTLERVGDDEKIREGLKRLGHDGSIVLLATDDTGRNIPSDIIAAMPAGDRGDFMHIGIKNSPGAEITHAISGAQGDKGFYGPIICAAKELNQNTNPQSVADLENAVRMEMMVTFTTVRFMDENGQRFKNDQGDISPTNVDDFQQVFSHTSSHFLTDKPRGITLGYTAYSIPEKNARQGDFRTLSEMGIRSYTQRDFPRAEVLKDLVEHLGLEAKKGLVEKPLPPVSIDDDMAPFSVAVFPASKEGCEGAAVAKGLANGFDCTQVKPLKRLDEIEKVLSVHDGFVFMPPAEDAEGKVSQSDLTEMFYAFFSTLDSTRLDPRDQDKPIVVWNPNGQFDPFLNVYRNNFANATAGIPPGSPEATKAGEPGTAWHEITEEDPVKAQQQIQAYLQEQKKYYQPMPVDKTLRQTGKKIPILPRDEHTHRVAIFTSATSESKRIKGLCRGIANKCAADGSDIIYGASDQHAMGSILKGFKKFKKKFLKHFNRAQQSDAKQMDADDVDQSLLQSEVPKPQVAKIIGSSTTHILQSESKTGQPPKLDHYHDAETIYGRMEFMIENADEIVIAPGGSGTVQEFSAALKYREMNPSAADKNIILVDMHNRGGKGLIKDKFWAPLIKAYFPNYPVVTKEEQKAAGIYIAHNDDYVVDLVHGFREEKLAKRKAVAKEREVMQIPTDGMLNMGTMPPPLPSAGIAIDGLAL